MPKYRLKGHGGFFMRDGWFAKGLTEVKENPRVFTKEFFFGADALGVGSAMAKAVKYWLLVSGLTYEVRGKGTMLTSMGEMICQNDLYLEDIFSIWLLHIHIVSDEERATFWYLFFHEIGLGEFTKEQMQEKLKKALLRYSEEEAISERSFSDDCNILLQMYGDAQGGQEDPEDKKWSVFSRLGLIQKTYRGFKRERVSIDKLPQEIVLIVLMRVITDKGESVENLLTCQRGPGKLLSLDRILLSEYLDILENEGYVRINRTAGLDMVYLTDSLPTEEEIICDYYKR